MTYRKSSKQIILHLVILTIIFLLRLGLSSIIYQTPSKALYQDSSLYQILANNLLKGDGFRASPDEATNLIRTIGYPAFLAGINGLFGSSEGNVALIQLLLTGLIGFLLYDLFSRLFSRRVAFWGALLYLCDPSVTLWSMTILSEPLFLVTVVLVIYAMIRWWQSDHWGWIILSGVSAALGTLIRPIGEILLPVWAVLFLLKGLQLKPFRFQVKNLKSLAVYALICILIVGGYSARNYALTGQFTVSIISRHNLGCYNAAAVVGELNNTSMGEGCGILKVSFNPTDEDVQRYKNVILSHPLVYLKVHLKGTLLVLFGIESADWMKMFDMPFETNGIMLSIMQLNFAQAWDRLREYMQTTPQGALFLLISIGYLLLIYILSILGMIKYINKDNGRISLWVKVICVLPALVLLFTPGPAGQTRFRIPAQPELVILATMGIAVLDKWIIALRNKHKSETD